MINKTQIMPLEKFSHIFDILNSFVENEIVDCDVLFEECAKFHGSRVIVGLVPWCHRVFEGPTFFLVGIS